MVDAVECAFVWQRGMGERKSFSPLASLMARYAGSSFAIFGSMIAYDLDVTQPRTRCEAS